MSARQPPSVKAKQMLIATFSKSGLTKAELARRMGVPQQEVTRILRPSHPTKIDTIAAALKALGRRLVLELS